MATNTYIPPDGGSVLYPSGMKHHFRAAVLGPTPVVLFQGRGGGWRGLQNWGVVDIVVGGPDVSASGGDPVRGFVVRAGQAVPDAWIDADTGAAWYAVTLDGSSGYTGVTVDEIY